MIKNHEDNFYIHSSKFKKIIDEKKEELENFKNFIKNNYQNNKDYIEDKISDDNINFIIKDLKKDLMENEYFKLKNIIMLREKDFTSFLLLENNFNEIYNNIENISEKELKNYQSFLKFFNKKESNKSIKTIYNFFKIKENSLEFIKNKKSQYKFLKEENYNFTENEKMIHNLINEYSLIRNYIY